jgi:hypothetical protein
MRLPVAIPSRTISLCGWASLVAADRSLRVTWSMTRMVDVSRDAKWGEGL